MKVCLAVDDSEISQNAVDYYHRVLHRDNNELIICHVAATCHDDQDSNLTEPHFFSRALEIQLTAVRDLEEKYKRLLSRYPNLLFSVKIQEKSSHTGASIVSLAHRDGCGLIIIGSRQLAGHEVDSVSDYVVHHSWIPVLVCPDCPAE